MLLKNILITTAWLLLPMTVFASGRLCESASAVVRNWKGEYIQADEPVLDEELTSTLYSEGTLFVDEMDPFKYTVTGYGISSGIARSGNLDTWADYENGGNGN